MSIGEAGGFGRSLVESGSIRSTLNEGGQSIEATKHVVGFEQVTNAFGALVGKCKSERLGFG